MKAKLCVLLAAVLGIFSPGLFAGNLKVNLTPSQAVTAGAQWRVDGGSWRNSGSTASGLSNGTHQVSFKAVTGWVEAAATNVTVTSGTTTVSYAYVQRGSLKITLTPSTGKWRVDSGAWQNSAATVANLAPGAHTVDYQALSGYTAPASESVTITSGQLSSLTRSYTQLSSLKITLTPSTGKWRVDGGTWQNSAATIANLTPGAHTVDYQALAGYAAPSSESVTLTSGQLSSLNRSYTQLASLTITLTPASAQWRVDGGAWQASGATVANLSVGSHTVDYAAASGYLTPNSESVSLAAGQALSLNRAYVALPRLTLNLTPSSAQWQVEGGSWRTSGSTATGLSVGSHTIAYSNVAGYITPSSELVTLAAGEAPSLSRSYVQLAHLTITLSNPAGQFRVDGGAWQPSGATVPNLAAGAHSVSYSAVSQYASPADESVTLAAGQSLALSRHYTQLAAVSITLNPASGQWRIDSGAWQASGATQFVAPGNHTIDYAAVELFDLPASEAISLTEGGAFTVTRNYTSQKPTLRFDLSPSSGQWRVDGGAWQPSGATVSELLAGNHSVDFADIGGIYDPPASESVALALRENAVLARTYPFKKATVTVTLDPSSARWRVDNGDWRASGTTAIDLPAGNHTLEYEGAFNYLKPATEIVSLTYGQNFSATRTYVPLASLQFNLEPTWAGAKWRVDGGPWIDGGTRAYELSFGAPHLIEFSAVDGYVTPSSQTITLSSGESRTESAAYQQLASISVYSDPNWLSAQYRIDGGAWTNVGQSTYNLMFGVPHLIEFSEVAGYVAPPSQTVTLAPGQYFSATATYQQLASISAYADPYWLSAQYRIDGGAWTNTGQSTYNLSFGVPHTIEFSTVDGYVAPPPQTVTLSPGQYFSAVGAYLQLSSISAYTDPYWLSAQYRIDGGTWINTGQSTYNLMFGVPHLIEFSEVAGYVAPPSQTVTLSPGQYFSAVGAYLQLASISAYADPYWLSAQYRIDGGAWTNTGQSTYNLAFGVPHLIEFANVEGYVTPPSQTVTLSPGQYFSAVGAYKQLGSIYVSINPYSIGARWRLDGGEWRNTSLGAYNLSLGVPHTVEFEPVFNYITPATETVTLSAGEMRSVIGNYTELGTVAVSLNPTFAQWRIDGGHWNTSGTYLAGQTLGSHTIEYSTHQGYLTPATETVTVQSGYNNYFNRTYAADPNFTINWSLPSLTVNLDPTWGEWRIDGGSWNTSGATRYNLAAGAHLVEYRDVTGFTTPANENLTPVNGQTIYRSYNSLTPAQLTITTNPASGQWRVYRYLTPPSGPWNPSGGTASNLNPGPWQIEYTPISGYDVPSNGFVQLAPNDNQSITANYAALPAQLRVFLSPTTGRVRINGGIWFPSGMSMQGATPGASYVLEFEPLAGYTAPPTTTVILNPGENRQVTYTYTPQ